MKLNKHLSPYPILSNADNNYVRGNFGAEVTDVYVTFGRLNLKIEYNLDDDGLKLLINQKKAVFVTHIECPVMGYREVSTSQGATVKKSIEMKYLTDKIEVSTYIVAQEDILGYRNKNFSLSFGKNASFDITKGSVLAIGSVYSIDISRKEKPYNTIVDILRLYKDENSNGEVWISTENDWISVYVSQEVLQAYHRCKDNKRYSLIQMIFVPTLMIVLLQMKKMEEDGVEEQWKWYQIIQNVLEQNNIKVDQISSEPGNNEYSASLIAQKIFKMPIMKAIEELNEMEEEE